MRNVVNEVENLLHDVGSAGGGTVHELKSRVGSALDSARQRLDAWDTGVRSNARRAATVTDDYVHNSPWQAIGIGAVVGLAAGLAVSLLLRRD
jgi:ElaB/YqjD/DUF883 family membrane-anchored ribosome-binding protein